MRNKEADMDEKTIGRINELARKAKAEGLTAAEKEEQQKLRRAFIESVRMNVKAQLDNIDVIDEDGNIENLGEKYGKKGN
jgi:5-formyltetrahydrofolate cyclo-ligase